MKKRLGKRQDSFKATVEAYEVGPECTCNPCYCSGTSSTDFVDLRLTIMYQQQA
jgi:putative bacteriocin precursor